jgi:arabinogalactan oligomer/maltooligosaccharide transport system substrate-binding protein
MKNLKRGLAAAAVAAVAATSFALAAPAQAASSTVTIWGDQNTHDAVMPALSKWAKTNKLTVNWVVKDFAQLRGQSITAIPTGSGPDIIAGAHDWTGKLLGAGVIAPISLGAQAKNFSASALSGFQVYGKQYGVPGWTENIALVYNKNKVSKPAATSAEFAKAIADGQVELSFSATNGDPYHFASLDTSFGLSQYKRLNGTWTTQIGEGGANGAKFANWLAAPDGGKALNSANGGDWSTAVGQLQDPNSKVAYWITGPWAVSALEADGAYGKPAVKTTALKASEIGVTSFPSIGGQTVHQFSGVRGYWESVKVPGSAKALSVGKVLNELASPELQSAVYNLKQDIPANQVALKSVKDPILLGFGKAGVNAYPMASFVFQDTTWNTLGKAEAAIIAGNTSGKSPADFWQAAIDTLQSTIDNS